MNSKQERTLAAIFERPTRADIKWSDVESLLLALGSELTEGRGSRIRIVLNDVRATFHKPHPRPVMNKSSVESMRRFLTEAGEEPCSGTEDT